MNYNHEDINPFTKKPVRVQGRVFFLCGTTGTRKTSFIREKIYSIPLPKRILDIDGEFLDFGAKQIDRKINSSLNFHADKFKRDVCGLWEHVLVFSEAGLFFTHGTGADLEMREILKGARRRGNFVFFDFHSLSEVPVDMLKFCNYLVIKKTVMETQQQLRKFSTYPEIGNAYRKVMSSKIDWATEIIIPRNLKAEF